MIFDYEFERHREMKEAKKAQEAEEQKMRLREIFLNIRVHCLTMRDFIKLAKLGKRDYYCLTTGSTISKAGMKRLELTFKELEEGGSSQRDIDALRDKAYSKGYRLSKIAEMAGHSRGFINHFENTRRALPCEVIERFNAIIDNLPVLPRNKFGACRKHKSIQASGSHPINECNNITNSPQTKQ